MFTTRTTLSPSTPNRSPKIMKQNQTESKQKDIEEPRDEGLDETACSPSFVGYLPESWSMLKDSIYAAQEAIRAGIENTQELLADHDVRLGRTTRSNRYTAERLEGEIRQMQAALDGLQKPNGCAYGESSPMAPHGARRQVDLSLENNPKDNRASNLASTSVSKNRGFPRTAKNKPKGRLK